VAPREPLHNLRGALLREMRMNARRTLRGMVRTLPEDGQRKQ
jgi:hypothetical protein